MPVVAGMCRHEPVEPVRAGPGRLVHEPVPAELAQARVGRLKLSLNWVNLIAVQYSNKKIFLFLLVSSQFDNKCVWCLSLSFGA